MKSTGRVDLDQLEPGSAVVTVPWFIDPSSLSETPDERLREYIISNSGPHVKNLEDVDISDQPVRWLQVGIFLGMRRLVKSASKGRGRRMRRRNARYGMTKLSIVRPVFMFGDIQVILIDSNDIMPLDVVPRWLLENVKNTDNR